MVNESRLGSNEGRTGAPFMQRPEGQRASEPAPSSNTELTGPAPGGAAAGEAMLGRVWALVGTGRCTVRVERYG